MKYSHGKFFGPKKLGVEIRKCLVGSLYEISRTCPWRISKGHKMQLSRTSKKLCSGKQCSCRSNGLKCVAACGGCRGTECQNCVTVELFEEE